MSERAPRVLIVEDDDAIAQGLLFNFEGKGYRAEVAVSGVEGLRRATEGAFDLIVLDVRLPGLDGFSVCQRLRAAQDFTPILMLTARGQPDDVIHGLKSGADDYVVKPFDLAELLARVEGLLRRQAWIRGAGEAATNGAEVSGRQSFGAYWVDFGTFEAGTEEGTVPLSQKEIAVMRVFLGRPNQVVTRRELLSEVWRLPQHPNERVVDNVIVALRQRFEADSSRPRHILSVRGVGYRFVP
jgi:DNA-binding response OmpR family regulator